MAGNERFASGAPLHPDETLERIRALEKGQHPFAVVVSCSDSRVPPELVFDQGFGDIFSIRTAGNVIGDYELGSVEYAVEHLNCSLVVVLGHENCGAISSFLSCEGHYEHFDHIKHIIDYIGAEAEEQALIDQKALTLQNAVQANIEHGVKLLRASTPILKARVEAGQLQVIGGQYDLTTGKISLLPPDAATPRR
jgi:carbonic anhydrase